MDMILVRNYLDNLERKTDQTSRMHARAIRAMFDTDQDPDRFRHSCVAIPVFREDATGEWVLKRDADKDAILGALFGPFVNKDPPQNPRAQDRMIRDVMARGTRAMVAGQPLVPTMLVDTATWLLFYEDGKFDGIPHSKGKRAQPKSLFTFSVIDEDEDLLTHIARMKTIEDAGGDPVEWFLDSMRREGSNNLLTRPGQ